jgi:serine/threonine-protein kinase
MAARLLTDVKEPRNNEDRLALIAVCKSMKRIARAALLYADAFAADPEFANGAGSSHPYDAACFAARAVSGDGEDAADLSEAQRASLRERARVWLRDDLVAKRAHLTGAPSPHRLAVPGLLETWLTDPALAGVRDEGALRKLSPAEREAWLALWGDVKSLLAEAKSVLAKPSR